MSKLKKETLRMQMRISAEKQLEHVEAVMATAGERAVMECNTNIDPLDVMRLMSGTQTKTLRDKLVTQLANEAETELMDIWTNQQSLDLGKPDAK